MFALWWMQVGLRHVDLLQSLLPDETSHWIGQRRMFFWEGLAWLALLLVGGFTSVYLLYREKRHLEGLKTFFASFNHDVKTSLTSLRLQAEALKEDLEGQPSSEKLLSRLISDTLRLQIQLENSLYMSAQEAQKLLIEEKNLEDFLVSTKHKWPQVEVSWNRGAKVQVDERGFYIVLNNLIQNAWNHGRATSVHFNVQSDGNQKVRIEFQDNGKGFSGSGKNERRDLPILKWELLPTGNEGFQP